MPSAAPCLLLLRRQLDQRAPARSKASDGIMRDPGLRPAPSDHHQGNAIDVTHDPARGCDAGRLAEALRRQMMSTPGGRVKYLIWNRRIASSKRGWVWRVYTGPSPHTDHVHISIHAHLRDVVRPWKLD